MDVTLKVKIIGQDGENAILWQKVESLPPSHVQIEICEAMRMYRPIGMAYLKPGKDAYVVTLKSAFVGDLFQSYFDCMRVEGWQTERYVGPQKAGEKDGPERQVVV